MVEHEIQRAQVRAHVAVVSVVGATAVATVLAPLCIALVLGSALPANAVGWAVIGGLFAPTLLFPLAHAATHRVFTGGWPGWLVDPQRSLELLAFGVWTAGLLVLALGHVVTAGTAALVWPTGIIAYGLAVRWVRER